MLCARCLRAAVPRRQLALARQFSASSRLRSEEPVLSTPVTGPGETPKPAATSRSVCAEGTVLVGLNYTKGGKDPVARKDEDYPEWLWSCLDVTNKKSSDTADEDVGDEFSKFKKERKKASKLKRAREAAGNVGTVVEIPLQHQSINLPGEPGGSVEDNIAAADKRQELKRAMRQERKAKIKEANYLKAM